MAKKQYGGPWRRIRKQILERDQHHCQIQGKNCTQLATQVDHITPVHAGGAWWDPTNLRASCATCNNQRAANRQPERWQKGTTIITLVVGPPKGGKSTWVKGRQQSGDIVIDYDTLADAFGSEQHEVVNAARNAAIRVLRQGKTTAPRAYIVSANPKAAQFLPHHKIHYIVPDRDTVLKRAQQTGAGQHIIDLIERWYNDTQPEPNRTSRTW